MQQKDNQLFSVVCRNSGNAVAPVQIKNLLKEVDTGKLLLRESVTGYFEKVQVLTDFFHAADSMGRREKRNHNSVQIRYYNLESFP